MLSQLTPGPTQGGVLDADDGAAEDARSGLHPQTRRNGGNEHRHLRGNEGPAVSTDRIQVSDHGFCLLSLRQAWTGRDLDVLVSVSQADRNDPTVGYTRPATD